MNRIGKAMFGLWVAATCFAVSCTPNQRILESSNSASENVNVSGNSTAAKPADSVENEIEAMRNADFFFIYVFRRKDGGMLDADDKRFMAAVIPYEINRKTLAEGGKALVTGSNFRFPPEAWKQMTNRYNFEDHSRSQSEIMATNSNASR